MRILAIALIAASVGSSFAGDEVTLAGPQLPPQKIARTIDLGVPGALDALEQDSPGHYAKVIEILRAAGDVSCETLPQMLKLQFDVKAASCSATMVLTSYPAKRRVWFQLDDTAYVSNMVLYGATGKLTPAR